MNVIEIAMMAMMILYPLNVVIYLSLKNKIERQEHDGFFMMLKEKKIDVFRFMNLYGGVVNKGAFLTMFIGIIYLVSRVVF